MKVRSSRIEGAFRPFGISLVFESQVEADTWIKMVLEPHLNVAGVRGMLGEMAAQMGPANDDDEEEEL